MEDDDAGEEAGDDDDDDVNDEPNKPKSYDDEPQVEVEV